MLAIAMVAVMAVMWFRVLIGRKPQSAAASNPALPAETQEKTPVQVCFQELPIIPGRNDCINRDFFAVQDWKRFRKNSHVVVTSTDTEVHAVVPDQIQEVVAKVAERLNLEAVLLTGEKPRAFVNNVFFFVGDTITLKEGTDTYEFEVVRIEADAVLVRCRERQLTLKVAQSNDVNK
ncbi:MAG: hypothetical protein ACYTAS_17585 [Planctomycetota bacterium]